MANLLQDSIIKLWEQLAKEIQPIVNTQGRTYRRLDLNKENGVRVSCVCPGAVWELIVEVGIQTDNFSIDFPNWRGMGFEIITLDVPMKKSRHIRIFLKDETCRDIFAAVCTDLVVALDSCISNEKRRQELSLFLDRWSRFFERYGKTGLSQEHQQGLYGELWWIRCMINKGVPESLSINAWKGCEQGDHDFELNGHVVEVKTTRTKEPRKVIINNERQLDDRGLVELHLFVLTIISMESCGETLPDIVKSLKLRLSGLTARKFENSLREAGYLDVHESLYRNCYTVQKEELFQVNEGFPRIISLPPGTGDLAYSITLSACSDFKRNIETYMGDLIRSI